MKKMLLVLIIIFIAIQFIRPVKNIHPVAQSNDISTLYAVSADVNKILAKACKDCHSNNTRYPWYYAIQPVAWWMNDHINTGKSEINFNEFSTYPINKQYHQLESIKHQVQKGDMPLQSYTIIHKDAILTSSEKNILIYWSEGLRKQLEAKYPKDSLTKKDDEE